MYNENDAVLFYVDRVLEAQRALVDSIENIWGANNMPISLFDYENDAAGRRVGRDDRGVAFGNNPMVARPNTFSYDSKSQVTGANMHNIDTYSYTYDQIGNRTFAKKNNVSGTFYTANALNQYSRLHAGEPDDPNNPDGPWSPNQYLPYDSPEYDADGNLKWIIPTSSEFCWNAENRLVEVKNIEQKIVFAYDHQGRRVQKSLYTSPTDKAITTPELLPTITIQIPH